MAGNGKAAADKGSDKGKAAGKGKAKGKDEGNDSKASGSGKLKAANSINVRHILVCFILVRARSTGPSWG